LVNNRVDLSDKKYLTPNYSNIEYVHFPNKEPFLTSNKRDFKTYNTETNKNKQNYNPKEFLLASKIIVNKYININ
jgi:hypothetical protein